MSNIDAFITTLLEQLATQYPLHKEYKAALITLRDRCSHELTYHLGVDDSGVTW